MFDEEKSRMILELIIMGLGLVITILLAAFLILRWILKRVNWLLYEVKLGERRHHLPPGDLGWPYIGNMGSFLKAFKSPDPESFLQSFITKYGRTGVYKAFMFGNPSIIVSSPETCKKVLLDDESFKPGWPISTVELIGRKSFVCLPDGEHKRIRRLTSAPLNGHEALSVYLEYIDKMMISALEKWSNMGELEFLSQMRHLTFRIIMYIFLSSESEPIMESLEKEYTVLNTGVRAMAINFPGFSYYNALKARKNLVAILETVVENRRFHKKGDFRRSKDMLDGLLDAEDENGVKMTNEEIIDILLMYLNAGHESSGHSIMWLTLFLQANPKIFHKAKAEQEDIVNRRPPTHKALTLKETREMNYLSKVIDEMLRIMTISLTVFREAKKDVVMNGYVIPKGWRVLVWFRGVHLDPELYPNPKTFDPSRWEGSPPKGGTFIPFGGGGHFCPGNDLAKLEACVFLHHFLLNYKLERTNPDSPINYLPHTRPKDNCLARITKCSS